MRLDGLFDLIQEALSQACLKMSQSADCWVDAVPEFDGPIPVYVPTSASDILGGQTAYITATDGGITIDMPGGLWIVKGMWNWSGLNNPLAVYRNFLIAFLWAIACVVVVILLPPLRTARTVVSQALVPTFFMQAADFGNEKSKTPLVHALTVIDGGSIAGMTLFEPRICKAPLEYLVPQLRELLMQTEQAVLGSLVLSVLKPDLQRPVLIEAVDVLKRCGKALIDNDNGNLKELKAKQSDNPAHFLADAVSQGSGKVLDATLVWLDAVNNPKSTSGKEGLKNVKKIYLPWLLAPLLPLKRISELLTLPFRPRRWNLMSILWSLKLTAGFVALFCADVYWDAYATFGIQTGASSVGAVYNGWQLLGYTFSWKPTVEGTFKKGIMRAIGTSLGGFFAWLGIIVCSWSYDDDAEINPYGLVAWLTVSTVIVACFSVDSGMASRLGLGYDHGYTGLYFVLAESLIALEVFVGSGTKGDLTTNRVVATLTGVAMAMFVVSIPPIVRGGDPKHARACYYALKDALSGLLRTMLSDDADRQKIVTDDYRTEFLQSVSNTRRMAMFLVKDASRLKALPFHRVNEDLKPLIEDMTVDESLLGYLLDYAVDCIRAEPELDSGARVEVEQILSSLEEQILSSLEESPDIGDIQDEEQAAGDRSEESVSLSHFLLLARTLRDRLKVQEVALNQLTI